MIQFKITEAHLSGLSEEITKALKDNNCILPESVKYVTKESIIFKLFERYGSDFPGESKESWKERWHDNKKVLEPVKFNDKHLLITMLHKVHPYTKILNFETYIKLKWGLKAYSSDVTRYINRKKAHPESKNITDLLKSD